MGGVLPGCLEELLQPSCSVGLLFGFLQVGWHTQLGPPASAWQWTGTTLLPQPGQQALLALGMALLSLDLQGWLCCPGNQHTEMSGREGLSLASLGEVWLVQLLARG